MSTPKNAKPIEKAIEKNDVETWTVISNTVGKSVYGHRLNTLASAMDEAIAAGKFTLPQIHDNLVKLTGKTAARIKQAVKAHIGYLGPNKGITVKVSSKGIVQGFATEKTK